MRALVCTLLAGLGMGFGPVQAALATTRDADIAEGPASQAFASSPSSSASSGCSKSKADQSADHYTPDWDKPLHAEPVTEPVNASDVDLIDASEHATSVGEDPSAMVKTAPPMHPDVFFKRVLAVLKSGELRDYYLSVGEHAAWAALLAEERAQHQERQSASQADPFLCDTNDAQCLQSKHHWEESRRGQREWWENFQAKLDADEPVEQIWQAYRSEIVDMGQKIEAGKLVAIGAAQLAIANDKTWSQAERAALLELHQRFSSVLLQTRFDDELWLMQAVSDALPLLQHLRPIAEGYEIAWESRFLPELRAALVKVSGRLGIDLESVLSSLHVQTLHLDGANAKVAISFRMLNVPVRLERHLEWTSHDEKSGAWLPTEDAQSQR